MSHSVQLNHKFVAVIKDGAKARYSAVHLGRVKSWVAKQEQEMEILTKEDFYNRGSEEVEVTFTNPHSQKVCTVTINRSSENTCQDPRMDSHWQF